MSRAAFDRLCTIYRGTSETKIDVPFAVHVPCRLVDQDGIFSYGANSLPTNHYLTMDAIIPLGSWVVHGQLNLEVGDWIEIESPGYPLFTVVYVRFVDWQWELDYFQAHLVPFRRVRRIADGGILLSGSAIVSTLKAGSGGILIGGQAIVALSKIFQMSATGGIVLSGGACPIWLEKVVIRYITDIVGTGGILLGGAADITTESGSHYLYDGFTHDSGNDLNGTSLEAGTGLPATWTKDNLDFFGTGSSAETMGAVVTAGKSGTLTVDTGTTDGIIEAGLYVDMSGGDAVAALACRFIDYDNFLNVQWNSVSGEFRLISLVAGAPSVLDSATFSLSTTPGSPTIVRVELVGTSVDVYVDGSLMFSETTSDNLGRTLHGLCGYNDGGTFSGVGGFDYWWFDL